MTYDWILLLRVQSGQTVLNRPDWGWPGVSSLGWTPGEAREIFTTHSFYINVHSLILHLDIQWLIKLNISQTGLSISKSAPPHHNPCFKWLASSANRCLWKKAGNHPTSSQSFTGINYSVLPVLLPKYFWKYLLSLHLYHDCSSSGLIIFCLIYLSNFLVHVSNHLLYTRIICFYKKQIFVSSLLGILQWLFFFKATWLSKIYLFIYFWFGVLVMSCRIFHCGAQTL